LYEDNFIEDGLQDKPGAGLPETLEDAVSTFQNNSL
jgi:hypothetical protein